MRYVFGFLFVTSLFQGQGGAQEFVRGDLDGDGRGATISDARWMGYTWDIPDCAQSGDANGDGALNIADMVFILSYLAAPETPWVASTTLGDGPEPPSPGPTTCGPSDPSLSLDCPVSGNCSGWQPPPLSIDHQLSIGSAVGAVSGVVSVPVVLDVLTDATSPGVSAYSFGVGHDPSIARIDSLRLGAELLFADPDFESREIFEDGWTAVVLLRLGHGYELTGEGNELYVVDYELIAEGETAIEFVAEQGDPAIPNMIVASNGICTPDLSNGGVVCPHEVWEPTTLGGVLTSLDLPLFLRGDANNDSQWDLADAVTTLSFLFSTGVSLVCPEAADVNDDGQIDIADPVYSLAGLFAGGPAPQVPGANSCGWDPSEDAVSSCDDSTCQ